MLAAEKLEEERLVRETMQKMAEEEKLKEKDEELPVNKETLNTEHSSKRTFQAIAMNQAMAQPY